MHAFINWYVLLVELKSKSFTVFLMYSALFNKSVIMENDIRLVNQRGMLETSVQRSLRIKKNQQPLHDFH